MKQYRPILAIRNCDGFRIGKKIGDLLADSRGMFIGIIMPPVPAIRLILGIDDETALVGKQVGVVGRDPEIEGHRPLVRMCCDARTLVVVTVRPHIGEFVVAENPWKALFDLLGNLVKEVAIKPVGESAANQVVAGVGKEYRRLKAKVPQSAERFGSEKAIQRRHRYRRR